MNEDELKIQEKEFLELASKVLEESRKSGVTLRLLGAIAFRIHCPEYKFMQYSLGRVLTDIDYAGLSREAAKVQRLFLDLGCAENQMVMRLFGRERRIFYFSDSELHSDVFFDKLRFCHDIDLTRRLEVDYPTISVSDLLLEKLQIVEINEKDLIDSSMLMCEHPVGDRDEESINGAYISELCSRDWGLWRTLTGNLERIESFLPKLVQSDSDREKVTGAITDLRSAIDAGPKSVAWRMRAKIGDKKKWYREVEEVERV